MDSSRDAEIGLPDEKVPLLSPTFAERPVIEKGGSDIVQFSAAIYYADEEESTLSVDIIRLGSMTGRISVKFFTEDGSAKDSEQYSSVSGELVFEDGEHTKSIEIPILHDCNWSPTCEFKIMLTEQINCTLGLYLYLCRVKILNCDPFPTDKHAEEVLAGEKSITNIDDWSLFWEYCKLNWQSAGVKWQTIFVLILDQMSNVILFGTLWVGVYIVDTLFARDAKPSKNLVTTDRYHTAMLIGLWFVVPIMVEHAWETFKIWLNVKGSSVQFLQDAMMRTYLDYTHGSRTRVSLAELDLAIDENAQDCAVGFIAVLNIVATLGKIFIVALFIILYQPDSFAITAVIIMPLMLIIFTVFRVNVSRRAQQRADDKLLVVNAAINEACHKFRLIADYFKRPAFSEKFSQALKAHALENIPVAMIELNTEFITKLLSGFVIFIYIVTKTPDVLANKTSLGIFLATISIFSAHLAEAITQLNVQLMHIIKAFVSLKEFTVYLNLPLELPALKTINRARRQATREKRNSLRLGEREPTSPKGLVKEEIQRFKSDTIPLRVHNLSFEYQPGVPVLDNVNISVPQGHMVAVLGSHGSGKSTFLSLLSNALIPKKGFIHIPSHLRVLNVSREPMFMQASLLENLAFGMPRAQVGGDEIERIKTILAMLGLSDMISLLEDAAEDENCDKFQTSRELQNTPGSDWLKVLNHTHKARMHIARALIANPEVMVLQRSFEPFREDVAMEMLGVLRTHVREKGLSLPEKGKADRRPRNVFFGSDSILQAAQADTIWKMQDKTIVSTTPETLLQMARAKPSGCADGCFPGALRQGSRS